MSVDERLRIGLSRNAQGLQPRRRAAAGGRVGAAAADRRVRWAGAAAGVLAAACTALALAVSAWWPGDSSAPTVPADSATSTATLQGRYAGEVAALPAGAERRGAVGARVQATGRADRHRARRPTRAWSPGCSTPSSARSCAPTCSARTSAPASRWADTPSREPLPADPDDR